MFQEGDTKSLREHDLSDVQRAEHSSTAEVTRVNDGNERRAPTELNTNSRHSLAKMQRLLMF